jgi:putative DNA primase/helicase
MSDKVTDLRKRAKLRGIRDEDLASDDELHRELECWQTEAFVSPPGEPLPNARRFVAAKHFHEDHALLIHQGGQFYGWNGSCWPNVDDAGLRAALYEHFEHSRYENDAGDVKLFAPTRHKVADLLDALRAVTHLPSSVVAPAWLEDVTSGNTAPADEIVACQNGLVHWPTRALSKHTPRYYAHHAVAFDFNPKAPAPRRWRGFLDELWRDDLESIETLQELFGYLVSGDTRLQKMFLIVGPRRSGKGTIARVMRGMLGTHHVAGPTLAGLATNFGLAPLIGKPVAIIADARLKAADSSVITERLLSISGEDTLTVDRKYREPWTGQIPARIVVLSNELPRLTDSSGALASRFIVLSMTESFYGRENPTLTDELLTELPGIFNWALDGLVRLRERGYFRQPTSSQEAIRELEDLGSPIGAFIREECIVGPEYTTSVDSLYAAWRDWCEAAGRSHPTTKPTFGRDLRAAVPGIRITQPRDQYGGRHREYAGIGLQKYTRPERVPPRADGADYGLARDGTRTAPMYSHKQYCPACDGEGCRHCGDTGRDPQFM